MNSLRRSFRKKLHPKAFPSSSSSPSAAPPAASPGSLCFEVSVSDVGLECSPLFQPTRVSVSVRRRRRRWTSERTTWEASLKSPREGFCFWHPPFSTAVVVTDTRKEDDDDGGAGHRRHKDIFLSVENVDAKGKKKLLAKTRVDLLEHRDRQTR